MKRRSFLSFLGIAPAAPLIANEITQVRPATAHEQVERIKRELVPSPPCWQLQPLNEDMQPWLGEWPREAECTSVWHDDDAAEVDLSITLPLAKERIGKPMPAYVRTYFMGKPVLTMPTGIEGAMPLGSLTIIQRVNLR